MNYMCFKVTVRPKHMDNTTGPSYLTRIQFITTECFKPSYISNNPVNYGLSVPDCDDKVMNDLGGNKA